MTCVVCLDATACAERVCSCSALACRVCLLALLDHGRERCAVCGSRFQPSAILNACLLGVEASPADPAKAHLKLGMAYAGAGDPLRALNSLAIAQHSVEPGSRWHSMIALETAQSHLAIGQVASAESCLRSVMPKLLELPRTVSSGVLFAKAARCSARRPCSSRGTFKPEPGSGVRSTSKRTWGSIGRWRHPCSWTPGS